MEVCMHVGPERCPLLEIALVTADWTAQSGEFADLGELFVSLKLHKLNGSRSQG